MSSRTPRTPRVVTLSSTGSPAAADSASPKYEKIEKKLDFKEWLRSKEENVTSGMDGGQGHGFQFGKTECIARDESGDCRVRGRELALHVAFLEAKLSEETQAKNRLCKAISEYDKQMSEKNRQIEILQIEKQQADLECERLKEQLEITCKHLDTIEISFNDVHKKYERAKQTIQISLQNVETLKESLAEHDLCISQKHEQFLKLKEHAMERMDHANSQLDLIERKYSLEASKLRAAVREAELDARSLFEQLEQRNRENAELTSICDGLIEKMDLQKNNGNRSHSDLTGTLKI